MKNGAETNVIARMTATVVNGTEIPRNSNGAASSPRRPNTRRRARPATDGGRTMGMSTTVSMRLLPRKARRARTNASGSPRTTVMTRLIDVVTRLSHNASSTAGVASAICSEPLRTALATRLRTGIPRNRVNRTATPRTERSPHRPVPPGRPECTARAALSSLTTRAEGTRSRSGSPGHPDRRTRSGRSWPHPRSRRP